MCLLFGSKIKLKRVSEFKILCEGREVQRIFLAKYLGVLLDDSMTGNSHASNVLKIATSRLAFFVQKFVTIGFQNSKDSLYGIDTATS